MNSISGWLSVDFPKHTTPSQRKNIYRSYMELLTALSEVEFSFYDVLLSDTETPYMVIYSSHKNWFENVIETLNQSKKLGIISINENYFEELFKPIEHEIKRKPANI